MDATTTRVTMPGAPLPVLLVSGTRPEVIKLAPVHFALREAGWAAPVWLHTGQHDAMAEQMLQCFGIEPAWRLARGGASLLDFAAACRRGLDELLAAQRFAAVVVQGDTESAFLGALAGFYRQLPVAHVEAGLRTHELARPFPEEGLRQMIARIARFHFAPTERAVAALRAEDIPADRIVRTGNTVVDAQHWVAERYQVRRRQSGRGHLLVTLHRREHWGDELAQLCQAIAEVARRHPELAVRFPVHLNPLVQAPVRQILGGLANVQLGEPLGYVEMQQALADAWLVLTDSGGLQEEAPTFGVPVLVLREQTERPELIEAGGGWLLGTHGPALVNAVERLLADEPAYRRMQAAGNPFGDGHAGRRIAQHLGLGLGALAPAPLASLPIAQKAPA